jgi:2-oxoglutarate dehydrogenase E1 component
VVELYQQYLEDKNSVDEAWWEFFADYTPEGGANGVKLPRGRPIGMGARASVLAQNSPSDPLLRSACGW